MSALTLLDFGVLIVAVIAHELGHYIFDWAYMKKVPKLKFYWGMVSVEEDDANYSLKMKLSNHMMGILAGIIPIYFFTVSESLLLIYLLMCTMDIAAIFGLLKLQEEKKIPWGTKMSEVNCSKCDVLLQEIKSLKEKKDGRA